MTKKITSLILALVITLAALAGTALAEGTEKGTLYVSFPTGNIRIAINILAQQLGYFSEEGVKVEEVNLGGMDALTAINGDGNLDLLTTGFVPDLQAIGNGYDLVIIGGTAVEGGAVITKEGEAAKYQDADKVINIDAVLNATLGFKRNEAAWVITRQYLLDNGVSAEQIATIEDEAAGHVKFYADETAVALEYALLYADAYGLEIVTPAGALQENYVCCRETTSAARLAEKADTFTAYERARIRAFEYYKAGESDADIRANVVNTVVKWSGKEPDYVETYLYGGVTKYAVDPNTKGIIRYVEAANNSGLLKSAAIDFGTYDITANVDTTVYLNALNSLIEEKPDNAFYAELLADYNEAN